MRPSGYIQFLILKKLKKKAALMETIKGKGIWECPESQNSGFQEKEEHKSKKTNK